MWCVWGKTSMPMFAFPSTQQQQQQQPATADSPITCVFVFLSFSRLHTGVSDLE